MTTKKLIFCIVSNINFPEIKGQNFIARDLMSNKLKTYDDAIREAASWYIRNTYPTYSKVPMIIENIRNLPLGNFVAFPAEILRTSAHLLNIGAKLKIRLNTVRF